MSLSKVLTHLQLVQAGPSTSNFHSWALLSSYLIQVAKKLAPQWLFILISRCEKVYLSKPSISGILYLFLTPLAKLLISNLSKERFLAFASCFPIKAFYVAFEDTWMRAWGLDSLCTRSRCPLKVGSPSLSHVATSVCQTESAKLAWNQICKFSLPSLTETANPVSGSINLVSVFVRVVTMGLWGYWLQLTSCHLPSPGFG